MFEPVQFQFKAVLGFVLEYNSDLCLSFCYFVFSFVCLSLCLSMFNTIIKNRIIMFFIQRYELKESIIMFSVGWYLGQGRASWRLEMPYRTWILAVIIRTFITFLSKCIFQLHIIIINIRRTYHWKLDTYCTAITRFSVFYVNDFQCWQTVPYILSIHPRNTSLEENLKTSKLQLLSVWTGMTDEHIISGFINQEFIHFFIKNTLN